MNNNFTVITVLFTSFIMTACVTTQGSVSSGTQQTRAPIIAPSLQVKIDCGSCKVRENIEQLILDGFYEATRDAGFQTSKGQPAVITIQGYIERGDTERFLAGAFAGKDEIKAIIKYQGKDYFVEDYYRNAWLGIEALAKKIGKMTFEKIAAQI